MKIKQKYRLELHWGYVEKPDDNVCVLKNAYFFGAALKDAKKIEAPNNIVLDLTPQYKKVLTSYYFATLFWKGVSYKEDRVYLEEAVLVSEFVNKISNLDNVDYILIDTEDHEENKHRFNLVYKGIVVDKEGKEY